MEHSRETPDKVYGHCRANIASWAILEKPNAVGQETKVQPSHMADLKL